MAPNALFRIRRLGLLLAGCVSLAAGLAAAWGFIHPELIGLIRTSGLVVILGLIAMPMLAAAAVVGAPR